MTEESPQRPATARQTKRSIFLPLAMVAVAVAGLTFSEVFKALDRRAALKQRIDSLSEPVEDSRKVRVQFETLANGVATLAASGNGNAKLIMDRLNKAGVNVRLGQ